MKNCYLSALIFFFITSIFIPCQISSNENLDIIQYNKVLNGSIMGITASMGFVLSIDNGQTWVPRNNGLPLKIIYPFSGDEYRKFTSLYVDPLNPDRIAITDSSSLYLSLDGGFDWEQIETGGSIKRSNYFTSVTLDPGNEERIILGTSFNGIFETKDKGKLWEKISIDLKPLYKGAGFYEEISALGIDPYNSNIIYISAGFSSGVFRGNYLDSSLNELVVPFKILSGSISGFDIKKEGIGIYSDNIFYFSEYENDLWKATTPLFIAKQSLDRPEDLGRSLDSADMAGIYVNSFHGSNEKLDNHFAFMKKNGINSLVIDMKDDEGKITYGTNLTLPAELGAVRNRFSLSLLLKKAKENNIYVIGRIVVFKDPMLYRYLDSTYAIWDSKKNSPWGNLIKKIDSETEEETWVQYEHWVDPFSEFVWKYNIAIAEELQSLGIDEIQFDYIRFPSDGNLGTAQYRNKRFGMTKIDAIESFMRVAREKIFIPISTDIYGFNAWYRMGNWIGQNIEILANYVDVISPMYYPSHFPISFLSDMEYLERAKYIYKEGTRRADVITKSRALIRPYVQAFLIGAELNMEYEEYTHYLEVQIEGIKEAGGSGYTMWNNSNRYYMVAD